MYFPYFRGKQFELITIRDKAQLISDVGFVPIVEPVKESLNGLRRAFDEIVNADGRSILIVNPFHGDFSKNPEPLKDFAATFVSNPKIAMGIALTSSTTVDEAIDLCEQYSAHSRALIHAGFTHARDLKKALGESVQNYTHIFLAESCSRLYRKHFQSDERVLIQDGFKHQKNSDYTQLEAFSDLHITYEEEGVTGFGDYLIVGNKYVEGGGPAYAVAIHLTFLDPEQDDQMFTFHFKSDTNSSPKDPAGKFAEALQKLIDEVERSGSCILKTSAVEEFKRLHTTGHFPGLGSVKKLSMIHHLETLANHFQEQGE